MTATVTHPLIDAAGPGWAATELHDAVIALTASMADLLHRTSVEHVTPIIVTTPFSRLTVPLSEVLQGVRGRWLVRTGPDRFYDGFTGQIATSVTAALTLAPLQPHDELATQFLERPIATRMRLIASTSTRHRVSRPVRLGGALESLSTAVRKTPPRAWGASEPVVADWDRDRLTQASRRRMRDDSFWVAVGDATAPMVATIRVARTREGLEETTRMTTDLGAPGDERQFDLSELAQRALMAAAGHGMPLIGFALAHVSTHDLTRPAHAEPSPQPLALMIGPAGVRLLGVPVRAWIEEFGAATIGSPRLPGVLFPLGDADGAGWARAQAIMARPDERAMREALSISPALVAALHDLESSAKGAGDA